MIGNVGIIWIRLKRDGQRIVHENNMTILMLLYQIGIAAIATLGGQYANGTSCRENLPFQFSNRNCHSVNKPNHQIKIGSVGFENSKLLYIAHAFNGNRLTRLIHCNKLCRLVHGFPRHCPKPWIGENHPNHSLLRRPSPFLHFQLP